MNFSQVLTRIKLKLGLNAMVTPFQDIDETIKTIITDITLPTFSIYCPDRQWIAIDTRYLEITKDNQHDMVEFILPKWKKKLIEVEDVYYNQSTMSGLGMYSGQFPLFESGIIGSYLLSNVTSQIMQHLVPKPTYRYIQKGHRLQVFCSYYSSDLIIQGLFEHDNTLASIPETARESFMKLALLDVKENLYPTLKMYTNIETAYGRIDLKLDGWDNAESERNELINQWDDQYHLDRKSWYFI